MNRTQTKNILILILITTIFSYSLTKIKIGNTSETQYKIYSIRFDWFGIDPVKLEKLITIPLENKLSELDSIYEIKSSIQFNKTVTTVWFYKTADINSTYQNIRQITEDLYNTLPSSVQKPQIYSNSMEQKSILCISFDAEKSYIESNIKPIFESIDQVAQATVTGGTTPILEVTYSPEKLSSLNLTPFEISETINNENSDSLFITKTSDDYIENYFFNNTPKSISKLQNTMLQSIPVSLSSLAAINLTENSESELVLLNDKTTVYLNLSVNPDANLISISEKCKKLLNSELCSSLSPIVIYDIGSIQKQELISTFKTLLLTILISTILIFLIYKNFNLLLLSIIETLLTIIWTIATFPIYNNVFLPIFLNLNPFFPDTQFIINSNSLSGISLSIGLITDVLLVSYELFTKSKSAFNFQTHFKTFSKSAITSTLTTILAAVPLFFTNSFISGISSNAFTIILMLFYSTLISLLFLPAFFNKQKQNASNKYISKLLVQIQKSLAKQKQMKIIFITLSILSIFFFIFSKKNISSENTSNIIYAQLTFNPEKTKESIQQQSLPFINSLQQIKEINFIKSEFTRGHAEFEIVYDKISEHKLTKLIKSKYDRITSNPGQSTSKSNQPAIKSDQITDAYFYISETSQSKRNKPLSLQFTVTGDSEPECRSIASEAANLISKNNLVLQTVLNFTKEEKMFLFIPDHTKLSKLNLSVAQFSQLLRTNIFSQVISKYFINNKETDIKLKNKNPITLTSISQIPITPTNNSRTPAALRNIPQTSITPTNISQTSLTSTNILQTPESNSIPLSSLGTIKETTIPSKMYRNNCRPCAYFTIELNRNNLSKSIKQIQKLLDTIKLKENYSINFPNLISETKTSYNKLFLVIIICIIFIYIFLTALNENPSLSFFILLTIPSSLFLPLSIKFLTNTSLTFGDLTGIILLSGIVINNSIYISESNHTSTIEKISSCIESILITSLTTIFSSLPMLIFSPSPFIKSLSFFLFTGTFASLFSTLFLFPSSLKDEFTI
ncbi:MAG: efflux RND transporter permease subunit [Treponema sp.]|nr:efflux RND transporter permease subunit [Candidatus Treponema scatequi]